MTHETPTEFKAKTWIFVAQAVVVGCLGAFSAIMGPLFLFGLLKRADGTPATDAGIAMTAMSVPLLLIFALAVFNILARRQPILRLSQAGIEIRLIGGSKLDRLPLIPGLVRVAWRILSTEGFRVRAIFIPWEHFASASVSGLPMARQLSIVGIPGESEDTDIPTNAAEFKLLTFGEVAFTTPLDQIAAAINSMAISSSWQTC